MWLNDCQNETRNKNRRRKKCQDREKKQQQPNKEYLVPLCRVRIIFIITTPKSDAFQVRFRLRKKKKSAAVIDQIEKRPLGSVSCHFLSDFATSEKWSISDTTYNTYWIVCSFIPETADERYFCTRSAFSCRLSLVSEHLFQFSSIHCSIFFFVRSELVTHSDDSSE